jgi:hypothetical protein
VTQFSYIAVLVSVVLGLGIVHLLSGVARLVATRGQWTAYWIHLLWTWNTFQFLVFFWWFGWRWTVVPEWTLGLFLFVLIYAVGLYLLCALLYPPGGAERDFRTIYYQNRGWFFGLWVALMLWDIVDTRLKEHYGLSGFPLFVVAIRVVLVVGSSIAMRSRSPRVHSAWALTFFAMMSTFQFLEFGTLRAS